jgi:hypothetical protein
VEAKKVASRCPKNKRGLLLPTREKMILIRPREGKNNNPQKDKNHNKRKREKLTGRRPEEKQSENLVW